jgi:hypothetical protein
VSKGVRLPVCQDDHACLAGWNQNDRGAEAGISTIMIDEVYAVYVGGKPAKRIMQIFSTSGRGIRGPTPAAVAVKLIAAGTPPDTLVMLHRGRGNGHPTFKLAVLAEPHAWEGTP